jgi:hypothetical protein
MQALVDHVPYARFLGIKIDGKATNHDHPAVRRPPDGNTRITHCTAASSARSSKLRRSCSCCSIRRVNGQDHRYFDDYYARQ